MLVVLTQEFERCECGGCLHQLAHLAHTLVSNVLACMACCLCGVGVVVVAGVGVLCNTQSSVRDASVVMCCSTSKPGWLVPLGNHTVCAPRVLVVVVVLVLVECGCSPRRQREVSKLLPSSASTSSAPLSLSRGPVNPTGFPFAVVVWCVVLCTKFAPTTFSEVSVVFWRRALAMAHISLLSSAGPAHTHHQTVLCVCDV